MSKKDKPNKTEREENIRVKISKNNILAWTVFIPTVIIVLLSLSSILFPALLTRSTSTLQGVAVSPDFVSPLEPGILAVPLIIINLIVLGLGFVYYKKKSEKFKGLINKISEFEISKKQALIAVIILSIIFVFISTGTLTKEETWVDYQEVKNAEKDWSLSVENITFGFNYFLLHVSLMIFKNIRIIPEITSLLLLILVYFVTLELTKKRVAGIIAFAIVLQSYNFLTYNNTSSYANFWIFFYVLSFFLIVKKWYLSPASYIISIFSKPLSLAFLPMTLYFIVRSTLPKRSKIFSLISYGIIIISIVIIASALNTHLVRISTSSDISQFWQGFSALTTQMRFDYIIILFLLPLTVMLFFASRKGIMYADSILICILCILLTSPLLTTFTDLTNQPYRFISLVVFFAIGVGVLLSKKTRKQDE